MKYLLLFAAWLSVLWLFGCVQAHPHVSAPSSAAAQGNVQKAKQSILEAKQSIKEAQRYNDISAEDARRIDAKASVLLKYLPQ